jgi:hypothetical protein
LFVNTFCKKNKKNFSRGIWDIKYLVNNKKQYLLFIFPKAEKYPNRARFSGVTKNRTGVLFWSAPFSPKTIFQFGNTNFQKFDISRKTCYNNSTKEKECGENEFMSRKCNPQTR